MDAAQLLSENAPTLPTKTQSLGTIGVADIDLTSLNSGKLFPFARRIFCGAAGTIYLKAVGDSAFTPYVVQAGQYLLGAWVAVGGSTTGTTILGANVVVAEQ